MKHIAPAHTFSYGGALFHVFIANKGEGLIRHEHKFNHATMCNSGSCIVRKENRTLTIDKHSKPIDLAANEWHEIEALEDDSVFVNVFVEGQY